MAEPQPVAEPEPPAPPPPPRPSRVPKAARRWILESVLIVASVLLAFGLNEFREARAERDLTARMLDGVQAEIEHIQSAEARLLTRYREHLPAIGAAAAKYR